MIGPPYPIYSLCCIPFNYRTTRHISSPFTFWNKIFGKPGSFRLLSCQVKMIGSFDSGTIITSTTLPAVSWHNCAPSKTSLVENEKRKGVTITNKLALWSDFLHKTGWNNYPHNLVRQTDVTSMQWISFRCLFPTINNIRLLFIYYNCIQHKLVVKSVIITLTIISVSQPYVTLLVPKVFLREDFSFQKLRSFIHNGTYIGYLHKITCWLINCLPKSGKTNLTTQFTFESVL